MIDMHTPQRRARIAEMQNVIELTEVVNDAAETFTACAGAPAPSCPFRRLWTAVLHTALADLADGHRPGRIGGARYTPVGSSSRHQLAVEWIDSTEIEEGSFEWVCEALDMDAAAIRAGIKRKTWKRGEVFGTRVIPQEVAHG